MEHTKRTFGLGISGWSGKAGLVVCILILLKAAQIALNSTSDGPVVPDLSANNQEWVIPKFTPLPAGINAGVRRDAISRGGVKPEAVATLDTGTIRRFAIFRRDATSDPGGAIAQSEIDRALDNLRTWERRRGHVLASAEQPVMIGDFFAVETGSRIRASSGWSHLKHQLQTRELAMAAGMAALAFAAFFLVRFLAVRVRAANGCVLAGGVRFWRSFRTLCLLDWPSRIGSLISILILIKAMQIAMHAVTAGPVIPDLSANSEEWVITRLAPLPPGVNANARRHAISRGEEEPDAITRLDTGNVRQFAMFRLDGSSKPDAAVTQGQIDRALDDLRAWERRRGLVLTKDEQPVMIGDFFAMEFGVQNAGSSNWSHLKHSIQWSGIAFAISVMFLVFPAFFSMRLLGVLTRFAYDYVRTGAVPGWLSQFER